MKRPETLFQHSLYQLRLRRYWPQKHHSTSGAFYFQYCIALLLACPLWIGILLHFIVSLRDKVDVNLSVDVAVLTSELGSHFMSLMFVLGQKKIAQLFDSLTAATDFGIPVNYEETVHKLNLYSKLYATYGYIGMFIYVCLVSAEIPNCRRINEEKNLQEVCGVIAPFWIPLNVDFNQFPYRQILLGVHTVNALIIILGGACISFTTYEVATAIVLKIKHLNKLLKEVFRHSENELRRKQLEHCIKYHTHIISLQMMFNDRYKYPNASYVIMVGIIIAALVNQYMKENDPGALLHLGGWVFSCFLCNHAGQILQTESLEISHAAYNSNWYDVPVDLQKMILMIIVRSQQPLELHAAPLGVMSHELYITLVKASSSYFALLNQST